MSDTPETVGTDVVPIPIIPTCEQMAMAAAQTLSGLPADRSGDVSWDHVAKSLYAPTVMAQSSRQLYAYLVEFHPPGIRDSQLVVVCESFGDAAELGRAKKGMEPISIGILPPVILSPSAGRDPE